MNQPKLISYRRALVKLALIRISEVLPVVIAIAFALAAAITATPGILGAAAVTIVRRRRTVFGNMKCHIFEISGGNTDTLDTRLRKVESFAYPQKTNAPTATAESTVNGYITFTFTAGGAFTNLKVIVFGW